MCELPEKDGKTLSEVLENKEECEEHKFSPWKQDEIEEAICSFFEIETEKRKGIK